MKVAVTGASGFLGRHVLRALAGRSGLDVVVAARSPMQRDATPLEVRQVHLDIGSVDPATAYSTLGFPDVLIHLAWGGLPNYRSLHHFEQQLPEQYRFLQGLVQAGLPSLTCAGTCFEYGLQTGELSEELPACPENPYGYAKDGLRRQLDFLRTQKPFLFTWARLFYMYGEGQPASSLYTQFMAAGARGDATFKMSGGDQLRDFLPVSRTAELIAALALEVQGGGIVNICSGKPTSVRSLVERWRAENGWNIELDLGAYPYVPYEPMAFWGSTGKLRSLLPAGLKESP